MKGGVRDCTSENNRLQWRELCCNRSGMAAWMLPCCVAICVERCGLETWGRKTHCNGCMDVGWALFWEIVWARNLVFFPTLSCGVFVFRAVSAAFLLPPSSLTLSHSHPQSHYPHHSLSHTNIYITSNTFNHQLNSNHSLSHSHHLLTTSHSHHQLTLTSSLTLTH